MGLFGDISLLSWEETRKQADDVRRRAVTQFLRLYRQQSCRPPDPPLWGDEVEYMLVCLDANQKKARLVLGSSAVLEKLRSPSNGHVTNGQITPVKSAAIWHPESLLFMVESTPARPYGPHLSSLACVEADMTSRRKRLTEVLGDKLVGLTVPCFPSFGCPDFTLPSRPVPEVVGRHESIFVSDAIFEGGHPRFRCLITNKRQRHGDIVNVNIPIYQDTNTKSPFSEEFAPLGDDGSRQAAALPGHVFLDSPVFGAGVCSVQVTLQAGDETEARILHDQLAVLAPIMMALSAGSPIQRGHLVDTDSRWPVVTQAWDERTPEERDSTSGSFVSRRRCDTIGAFVSAEGRTLNDTDDSVDPVTKESLIQGGVDPLLAGHVAGILSRDPLLLLAGSRDRQNEDDFQDFENLQASMWRTVKLKLPDKHGGWRVELRSMDVQLTEAENAALVSLVVLTSRALLHFRLSLAIPVSKLDANIETAQQRDAVRHGRFHFSQHDIAPQSVPNGVCRCESESLTKHKTEDVATSTEDSCKMATVDEIINGSTEVPGLVPLIKRYLDDIHCDDVTKVVISRQLALVSNRASGKSPTRAAWIRDFVTSHPDYRKDSVVSDSITFDLLTRCAQISSGKIHDPVLLPDDAKRPEM